MPWLGYFYKIAHCGTFVILDNVDFQQGNHNSITNRTKIKFGAEEKFITVPVKRNEVSKLIKDIKIDKLKNSFKKHARSIQLNYTKATHFKELFPRIEKLMLECSDIEMMSQANEHIIKTISLWLSISTPIVNASALGLSKEDRNERIIEICKVLHSEIYLSGNGGRKYHDEKLFNNAGITIKYTEFSAKPYFQTCEPFIPGLSIIDVLLNCGIEETMRILK
jgi:hypothetical protein